jgi:hypothetical protein
MTTVSATSPRPVAWSAFPIAAASATRAKTIALTCAVIVAAVLRVPGLDVYGFSEDEINKVNAVAQYRTGHFGANAEHPMLMKVAMWGSVAMVERWNQIAPTDALPLETAIRLPNALAGAATAAAMFGVADLLFGSVVASVAAAVWAVDVNAIAINRIGKEDTFLLLFFLLAVFCYERGKREGAHDVGRAQHWYTLSGAAFGLMLASKYMPQYLGIYALFNLITDHNPGPNKPDPLRHFGAMAATFLIANATIVLPSTWTYFRSYVAGDMLMHHGYLYDGALYVTNVPVSPLGVPIMFYLRLLATKVPLVILAAVVPGALEMVRRRGERGFVLLRVLAVFLLVPYSLMAAKFLRYSLPMLATVDLIASVGLVAGVAWLLRKNWLSRGSRLAAAAGAIVVFVSGLALARQSAAPYYSLFQNAVGAELNVAGRVFPEETYDYGVREAADAIAQVAAPSAAIVSDAPAVVAYYLRAYARPDIAVRSLSAQGLGPSGSESWVIVQDEHLTFENQQIVSQLRAAETPWREIRVEGRLAAQVFRIRQRKPC